MSERQTLTAGMLIEKLGALASDTPLQAEVVSEGQFGFNVQFRAPGESLDLEDFQTPVIIAAADSEGNPL